MMHMIPKYDSHSHSDDGEACDAVLFQHHTDYYATPLICIPLPFTEALSKMLQNVEENQTK